MEKIAIEKRLAYGRRLTHTHSNRTGIQYRLMSDSKKRIFRIKFLSAIYGMHAVPVLKYGAHAPAQADNNP